MARTVSRRSLTLGLGTLFVGGWVAGCAAPSPDDDGGDAGPNRVEMTDDLTFDPPGLSINVGETVVWENVGSSRHSVTAYGARIPASAAYFASGEFDAEDAARDAYPDGAIAGGETFEHTFDTAGEFEYFCIPHESAGMTGTIDVD